MNNDCDKYLEVKNELENSIIKTYNNIRNYNDLIKAIEFTTLVYKINLINNEKYEQCIKKERPT